MNGGMTLPQRLDDIGKPAWIFLMVLGFIFFWPAGLAILAYLIWSGRMGCWTRGGNSRWQERMDRMQEKANRWAAGFQPRSSGNAAFDEYRAETLRRLEEEEREFKEFLTRLRQAKDKAEFDQFMAERRRPQGPTPEPQT